MNNFPWLIKSFDQIEFDKIKSYAERLGWKNIRWINGGVVGLPPRPPRSKDNRYWYYDEYTELPFHIEIEQLKLF